MSYSPHVFGIVSSGVSQAGKFVLTNSNGDVEFPYGDKVQFGNDVELQVYHDGLHSYITSSSGLKIGTESSVPITIGNSTSEVTVADNLTVTGDFTVNGTTTTVNSTTVTIDDLVFNIAADAGDSAGCDGAGITIGDGTTGADASILYDHTGTQWELNKATEVQGNLNVVGTITGDTSLTLDAVTITTAEIGVLDGVTLGTAAASKAMTWAADSTWTAAGGTCANLGTVSAATSITATDLIGTNVDGIIGADTPRAGTFTTVDATTDFTIDGLVITADTITNDAALEVVSTGLTLNASLDIALSADGGNVTMDDGTTTAFDFNVDDVELKIHDDAQVANYCSIAVGNNGATTITTVDADDAAANLIITADGTVDIDSAGALTLDAGAAINLEPATGSAILLDGTISIDAGVVTGATSITSTAFVGTLSTAAQANVTSVGTLTALAVDNITIDGNTISSTAGTDLNITPLAGQQIVLDGAIVIDAGVVTGATSITSTDLIGTNIDGIIGADTPRAGTFTTLACTAGALAIASLDIDNGTDIGEDIADTDLFIIDNGANGTNRKCAASRLKTYVGSSTLTVDTSFSDTETIGSSVNIFNESSDMTINLPASHSAGDRYYIKNRAASNILTVGTADSDTIDGGGTKILYHQYEAITVISDGNNWHTF